jgi:hypothetical protein
MEVVLLEQVNALSTPFFGFFYWRKNAQYRDVEMRSQIIISATDCVADD